MCPACDVEVQEVGASEPVAEPRRLPWLPRLNHVLGEVSYMDDAYTARRRAVGRPPSRISRCGASRRSGPGWTGARSSTGSSAGPVSYSSTCSPGAGDDWNLIFCRKDGYPLEGAVVTRAFQKHLKAAGLPRVRFHDLRHGAATYLLGAGVPMRVVMDQLGHSQMSTTSDLYSHVLPEVQREASEKVASVLFGAGA